MNDDTPTLHQDIATVVADLPAPVRAFFASGKASSTAKNLATKYKLPPEDAVLLEREMILILLGLKSPDEFVDVLIKEGKTDEITIAAIVREVNDTILVPLGEEVAAAARGKVSTLAPSAAPQVVRPVAPLVEPKVEKPAAPAPAAVAKPEPKPEPKVEVKPEPKPEPLPEPKPIPKPEPIRITTPKLEPTVSAPAAPVVAPTPAEPPTAAPTPEPVAPKRSPLDPMPVPKPEPLAPVSAPLSPLDEEVSTARAALSQAQASGDKGAISSAQVAFMNALLHAQQKQHGHAPTSATGSPPPAPPPVQGAASGYTLEFPTNIYTPPPQSPSYPNQDQLRKIDSSVRFVPAEPKAVYVEPPINKIVPPPPAAPAPVAPQAPPPPPPAPAAPAAATPSTPPPPPPPAPPQTPIATPTPPPMPITMAVPPKAAPTAPEITPAAPVTAYSSDPYREPVDDAK